MPEIFNRMALYTAVEPDVDATACQAIDYLQQLATNVIDVVSEASQVRTFLLDAHPAKWASNL